MRNPHNMDWRRTALRAIDTLRDASGDPEVMGMCSLLAMGLTAKPGHIEDAHLATSLNLLGRHVVKVESTAVTYRPQMTFLGYALDRINRLDVARNQGEVMSASEGLRAFLDRQGRDMATTR